jgi:hypothetical protein
MKLRILVAAMLAAVLVLIPTAADAKGAKDMTLSGPGLASPIRLDNTGTDAGSSPNTIAEKAGLFAALFGETPDRLSGDRPKGDLGPRYVATYQWLIGQDATAPIRQDVYPFADGGAVTYTPPRQKVGGGNPPGGWYRAGGELTMLLVAAGVPVPAPYAPPVAITAAPRLAG